MGASLSVPVVLNDAVDPRRVDVAGHRCEPNAGRVAGAVAVTTDPDQYFSVVVNVPTGTTGVAVGDDLVLSVDRNAQPVRARVVYGEASPPRPTRARGAVLLAEGQGQVEGTAVPRALEFLVHEGARRRVGDVRRVDRSEERRVGKECRVRGAPKQYKNKERRE